MTKNSFQFKFQFIEGERIIDIETIDDTDLYVATNLGRVFKKTEGPMEMIDFIECEELFE